MHRTIRSLGPLVVSLTLVLATSSASAKSHLWRFTEIFSNAQGNIQFIEMFVFDPAGTAETQFIGRPLTSNANTFIFPNDLPNENTFERWVLISTQDFANLPGAPAPDYILPAQFFDPAGDEIRYRNTIDIFPFPAGVPTNGTDALLRDLSTATNSPTNFAGDSGSVSVAPAVPALARGWGWGLVATLLVGLSWVRRSKEWAR